MEQFTAKDARQLSNVLDEQELNQIIQDIKEKAKSRHTQLCVYGSVRPSTIHELTHRGFEVKTVKLSEPISSNTFHVISW
jgi:hypothetical protein